MLVVTAATSAGFNLKYVDGHVRRARVMCRNAYLCDGKLSRIQARAQQRARLTQLKSRPILFRPARRTQAQLGGAAGGIAQR